MTNPFEKRDTERIRTEKFKITYRLAGDLEHMYEVDLLNVSTGGLLFIRDSVLARNDIIEVLFPFRSKKIILKASIIRLEGREVAAKFVESPTRIEEFVEIFNKEYKHIQAEYIQQEKKKNSVIVVDERDKFLDRKREIDKLLDL